MLSFAFLTVSALGMRPHESRRHSHEARFDVAGGGATASSDQQVSEKNENETEADEEFSQAAILELAYLAGTGFSSLNGYAGGAHVDDPNAQLTPIYISIHSLRI